MNSLVKQNTKYIYYRFFTFITLLFSYLCHGQHTIDSLETLSFETLEKRIKVNSKNPKAYLLYTKTLLDRAKAKNDSLLISKGYYFLRKTTKEFTKKIQYLDSAISYTKKLQHEEFPVQLYLTKGNILYEQNEYSQTLENFLLAEKSVRNKRNAFYYDIKFNIGFLQRTIGEYKSAEETFIACLAFENTQNIRHDILFQLSNVYYETGQHKKATSINKSGIEIALKNQQLSNYYHFVVNEGINLSLNKKYDVAIDSIEKALPHLYKEDQLVGKFYLGKSYHAIKEIEKALTLFKVIDTAFSNKAVLLLPMRESYVFLIKDAKQKNDTELQLHYMDQLLKLDSVHHKQYKDLSLKIEKEYNTPKILADKELLIEQLTKSSEKVYQKLQWSIGIVAFLCMLVFVILWYNFRLKKQHQKRFRRIMEATENTEQKSKEDLSKNKKVVENSLELDAGTVEKILERLQVFENEKQYLQNQISLHDVAKITQTNTKYLSNIINSYKNKNFKNYINELRIDYSIDRIQHDEMYKKYTIKAIAQEAGFTNSGAYFRAFQKKTGLKPSYFIKKVRQEEEK